MRHGESVANRLRVFSNSGHKHPLTEKGIEQAQALANSLADVSFAKIYTSPVLRAIQTGQILNENRLVPLEITEALREWDVGIYEGTTDPMGWEMHRQVQEDWFFRQQFDQRMPGGESFNEIKKRFAPFIAMLVQNEQFTRQNLLLVGHGGLFTAMLPVIFTNVDHQFAYGHLFGNTAYAIAETRPDGLFCLSWCGETIDA